jgi:hypothetical protein
VLKCLLLGFVVLLVVLVVGSADVVALVKTVAGSYGQSR